MPLMHTLTSPFRSVGATGVNGTCQSTRLRLIARVLRTAAGSFESEGMSTAMLSLSAGFRAELSGVRNIVLHGVLSNLSPRDAQGPAGSSGSRMAPSPGRRRDGGDPRIR